MEWFSMSSTYYMDPAVEALSPRAENLMTRALGHCANAETDGVITQNALKRLGILNWNRYVTELELNQILIPNGDRTEWTFRSWDKWQEPLNKQVRKRKADRERVAERRAEPEMSRDGRASAQNIHNNTKKKSTNVLQKEDRSVASSVAESDPEHTENPLFTEWWKCYPRKVGKEAARKAFEKALGKTNSEKLLTGVQQFAADPNLPEKQFVPHPATWLNEGRWDDEPLPPRRNSGPSIRKSATERANEYLNGQKQYRAHGGNPLPPPGFELFNSEMNAIESGEIIDAVVV